jgi:hypothetical protein
VTALTPYPDAVASHSLEAWLKVNRPGVVEAGLVAGTGLTVHGLGDGRFALLPRGLPLPAALGEYVDGLDGPAVVLPGHPDDVCTAKRPQGVRFATFPAVGEMLRVDLMLLGLPGPRDALFRVAAREDDTGLVLEGDGGLTLETSLDELSYHPAYFPCGA